jgi:Ca2+-binding RTX toxin-like protein
MISADPTGYTVSNAAGFPAGHAQGCDSGGGSEVVHCPYGVTLIIVATEGGSDTVHIDESVPPRIQVRIDGGTGPDSILGGVGNEVIEAGDDGDADLLEGGPGDDALIGARTDYRVPVSSGRSVLIGSAGDDVLVGGDPCDGDHYNGGPGDDNANFFRFTPGVSAQIGGPVTRSGASGCTPGQVTPSVEALEGSPGPDILLGDSRSNTLSGGDGDDLLRGGGGPDRLVGGRGNDRLIGGPGRDSTHQ